MVSLNSGTHEPASLAEFMEKYSVPNAYTPALDALCKSNSVCVLICDNSISMENPLRQGGIETRWEKLQRYANVIREMSLLIGTEGLHLCFLNPLHHKAYEREHCIKHIKTLEEIKGCFQGGLSKGTPLITRINEVLNDWKQLSPERSLMLLVATDGLNTNGAGFETHGLMKNWIQNTFAEDPLFREHAHINFILLTDEESVINDYAEIEKLKGSGGENLSVEVTNVTEINEEFEGPYSEGIQIGEILTRGLSKFMDTESNANASGNACVIS